MSQENQCTITRLERSRSGRRYAWAFHEELERRNYSQSTVGAHVRTIRDLARYFNRPLDQLGPEQLGQYQAYLFRECKLAPNTVNSERPRFGSST